MDASRRSLSPAARTAPPAPAATFVVGTFNVHAGVDGWGRPFDVVAACGSIDADVLVLEENWAPQDGPSIAATVGEALGYRVVEHALAAGRLARPDPDADSRWMRPLDWRGASHAIFLDSERPHGERIRGSPRYQEAASGRWGIAVLSRLPVVSTDVVELGRLARDRARRAALVVKVAVDGAVVTVVGTHMSHLTYGAPLQFVTLGQRLGSSIAGGPAVLAGDMNLWGPPVRLLLPRWHRALVAKTWPAWRPHSQVDHVLVRGGLRALDATALPMSGSDHRPVRARLALPVTARLA